MDIVHPRVAGIDVHKRVVWVAVRLPGAVPGERKVVVRSFKTFWRSLQKMAAWLAELGVSDAAMESTGVYWWPVYHALAQAGSIEVCVCNAAHMRNVPGRKTDPLTELRGEVPQVSGRIAGRVATFPDHDHRRGGAAGSVAAGGAAVRIA
jgi:transposase